MSGGKLAGDGDPVADLADLADGWADGLLDGLEVDWGDLATDWDPGDLVDLEVDWADLTAGLEVEWSELTGDIEADWTKLVAGLDKAGTLAIIAELDDLIDDESLADLA